MTSPVETIREFLARGGITDLDLGCFKVTVSIVSQPGRIDLDEADFYVATPSGGRHTRWPMRQSGSFALSSDPRTRVVDALAAVSGSDPDTIADALLAALLPTPPADSLFAWFEHHGSNALCGEPLGRCIRGRRTYTFTASDVKVGRTFPDYGFIRAQTKIEIRDSKKVIDCKDEDLELGEFSPRALDVRAEIANIQRALGEWRSGIQARLAHAKQPADWLPHDLLDTPLGAWLEARAS